MLAEESSADECDPQSSAAELTQKPPVAEDDPVIPANAHMIWIDFDDREVKNIGEFYYERESRQMRMTYYLKNHYSMESGPKDVAGFEYGDIMYWKSKTRSLLPRHIAIYAIDCKYEIFISSSEQESDYGQNQDSEETEEDAIQQTPSSPLCYITKKPKEPVEKVFEWVYFTREQLLERKPIERNWQHSNGEYNLYSSDDLYGESLNFGWFEESSEIVGIIIKVWYEPKYLLPVKELHYKVMADSKSVLYLGFFAEYDLPDIGKMFDPESIPLCQGLPEERVYIDQEEEAKK